MTLYFVPGEGIVDDAERDMPFYGELPMPGGGDPFTWGTPGIERLPEYTLSYQFGAPIQWRPDLGGGTPPGVQETAPGYINQLLQWAEADAAGQLQPFEREQWETLRREALSVPTRDVQGLRFAWEPPEEEGWGQILGVGSPDLGAQLLGMRERLASGTATPHEQALYTELQHVGADWNYRASVPQASDAFNPLGDQLFGALAILGTGATAGLAAAPLVAGGAGLATTLGSLGSLAGTAGGWAGTIGGATGQGWLANIGTALGAVGGIAGGLGGLGNLFSTGITSVADAARVAQAAGRITGGLGKATGADPLKQASSYLGLAGGLGQASGVAGLLGAASGVQQAATSALTEQGGRMADFSYDDFLGWGGDETQQPWYDWATQTSADDPAMAAFLGWGGDETQQPWYDPAQIAGGGGDWLSSVLGGLGSVGRFLGSNASVLGPLVGAGTSLGSGLLGSRASSDAARLQAAALNRGLDLSTAQWLAQEARLAPWAAAGQSALGNLQGMAGQALPQIPGQTPAVSGANYALPGATPGWTPQTYQGPAAIDAGAYRYTPGQGPRAADYRYAPGQI
ncbi:MAG: hypothetical protein ACRD0M_06370, partial [Acidimicrobiales bacterium]